MVFFNFPDFDSMIIISSNKLKKDIKSHIMVIVGY